MDLDKIKSVGKALAIPLVLTGIVVGHFYYNSIDYGVFKDILGPSYIGLMPYIETFLIFTYAILVYSAGKALYREIKKKVKD